MGLETDEIGNLIGSLPQHILGDDFSLDVIGTLYHQKNHYEGCWYVFYSTSEGTSCRVDDGTNRAQKTLLLNGENLFTKGDTIMEAEGKMWELLNSL